LGAGREKRGESVSGRRNWTNRVKQEEGGGFLFGRQGRSKEEKCAGEGGEGGRRSKVLKSGKAETFLRG